MARGFSSIPHMKHRPFSSRANPGWDLCSAPIWGYDSHMNPMPKLETMVDDGGDFRDEPATEGANLEV